MVKDESIQLGEVLKKEKGYKILLYIDSKQISTEDFFLLIEEKQMKYSDVVFIVGGAYGVDYERIKNEIDMKISFSPMTFPHAQALMILLEQIYRVSCIKKGVQYHH